MPNIYVTDGQGGTKPMEVVHCRNEAMELQRLLEQNPNLLPGEQIDPENPRRWLLIRREMPVHDPNSGDSRWSIDFFFVDQSGTPTFVECKRYADTRARREVVGQMLEYAANGQFYWSKELIRDYAEDSAKNRRLTLDEAIEQLHPDDDDTPDAFIERIANNLREGQVRLIFFMEEAPAELKSIVDFLNKQMERSEVLLVEAKQYRHGEHRIVVPTLFGYTEQARAVKKTVTVKSGARKKWDEGLFFADASKRLGPVDFAAIKALYEFARTANFGISFGTGVARGSFSIVAPQRCSRSFVSVFSDGQMMFNFGYLYGSAEAEAFREQLRNKVAEKLGASLAQKGQFPSLPITEWRPKSDIIYAIVKDSAP